MSRTLPTLRLLTAGLLLAAASHAHADGYTFIDLGTPAASTSSASGINNLNQIVGTITGNGPWKRSAALWSGSSLTILNPLGAGQSTMAAGINDSGQIVGENIAFGAAGTSISNAVVWNGSTPTALPMADLNGGPPAPSSTAMAINNSGQVVGASTWPYLSSTPAAWSADGSTVTKVAEGCCGAARAINSSGVIVGNINMGGVNRATLWDGSTTINLGAQTVGYSTALDINDAGQTVGASGPGTYRATTWINGQASMLASLGGDYSTAHAINNAGWMVGTASVRPGTSEYNHNPSDMHAVLWIGTTAVDLNSFLDVATVNAGWVLRSATDINDNGWIVGTAVNNQLNLTQAFALAPAVPEASTAAMMLIGFAGLTVLARRRRGA